MGISTKPGVHIIHSKILYMYAYTYICIYLYMYVLYSVYTYIHMHIHAHINLKMHCSPVGPRELSRNSTPRYELNNMILQLFSKNNAMLNMLLPFLFTCELNIPVLYVLCILSVNISFTCFLL